MESQVEMWCSSDAYQKIKEKYYFSIPSGICVKTRRSVFQFTVQLSDSRQLHNRKSWQQVNNCSLLPSLRRVNCSRKSSPARLFLPGKFGKFCRPRRSQQRTACGDKRSRGHPAHDPPTRVILNNHLPCWACSALFLVVTGNTGQRCFWRIPSHAFRSASWTNITALIWFSMFFFFYH